MKQFPNILIACDKFKGSLTAEEACAALSCGFRAIHADAEVVMRPIADGGEGFAVWMASSLPGCWVTASACDPLGRRVESRYYLAETVGGTVAVIEMAEASGAWRVSKAERDVWRSSTYGTGELMRHAVEVSGASRLIVGLGGSATNDGGAGMAAALGVRFLTEMGGELQPSPQGLAEGLAGIDESCRIALPPVTAACDVDAILTGPHGATRVFGPQKGADDAMMARLEAVLASLVLTSGGEGHSMRPGAGAAGGLGFGLMRFADAELTAGFDLAASLTDLSDRMAEADLVVTGEGSLDAQSLAGKGPVALARLARRHGKPVVAFCGRADAAVKTSGIFDQVIELRDCGLAEDELMSGAARLLEDAARSRCSLIGR